VNLKFERKSKLNGGRKKEKNERTTLMQRGALTIKGGIFIGIPSEKKPRLQMHLHKHEPLALLQEGFSFNMTTQEGTMIRTVACVKYDRHGHERS